MFLGGSYRFFNDAVGDSNDGTISWHWIETSVEGSGRGLIYGTVLAFERMTVRNLQDTSVEISGLWIDI